MVTLISRWSVRTDISDDDWADLVQHLRALADTVEAAESATLVYRVHTAATGPGTDEGLDQCDRQYVTFYEVYEGENAFQAHLKGKPFNNFLRDNLRYFQEDPQRKGHPLATTTFLDEQSGFFRDVVDQEDQGF